MKYSDIPLYVTYETKIERKTNVDGKIYYRPLVSMESYEEIPKLFGFSTWVKNFNKWGSIWVEEPYRWIRYSHHVQTDCWYESEEECQKMIDAFKKQYTMIEPHKQHIPMEW